MKWELPHKIKIYEALGTIGDKRIVVQGDAARVRSSSGGKSYDVVFDRSSNAISANDNGSYWKGYLGYPSIAFLMENGLIKYNSIYAEALKGIAWKDVNTKFKNDFEMTTDFIHNLLKERKVDLKNFLTEVESIYKQIIELKMEKLGQTSKPPEGY